MSSSQNSIMVKGLFILGTTVSTFAAGGAIYTSFIHIPGYLTSPDSTTLLKQWQTFGSLGKAVVPPMALIASGAHFINSYAAPDQSQRYRFFGAGVLSLLMLPYTVVALGSTNAELGTREHNVQNGPDTGLKNLTIKDLIKRWGARNAVRGYLLLASAIVGFDGMLQITY